MNQALKKAIRKFRGYVASSPLLFFEYTFFILIVPAASCILLKYGVLDKPFASFLLVVSVIISVVLIYRQYYRYRKMPVYVQPNKAWALDKKKVKKTTTNKSEIILDSLPNTQEVIKLSIDNTEVEQISLMPDSSKSLITINGAWRSGKSVTADGIVKKLLNTGIIKRSYYHSLWGFGNPSEGIDELFIQLSNITGISEFRRLSPNLTPDIDQTFGFNGLFSVKVGVVKRWFVEDELFRLLKKIQGIFTNRELKIVVILEDLDRLDPIEATKWLRVIEVLSFLRGSVIMIVTTNRSDLEQSLAGVLPNPKKYLLRTLPNEIVVAPEISVLIEKIDSLVKRTGVDLFKNEANDENFIRNVFLWTISLRMVMEAVSNWKTDLSSKGMLDSMVVDPVYRNQFLSGTVSYVAREYRALLNSYIDQGREILNQDYQSRDSQEAPAVFVRAFGALPDRMRQAFPAEFWEIEDWYSGFGFSFVYIPEGSTTPVSSFEGATQERLLAYNNIIKPAIESLIENNQVFRAYSYSMFDTDIQALELIMKQLSSTPNKKSASQAVGKVSVLLNRVREDIFFKI